MALIGRDGLELRLPTTWDSPIDSPEAAAPWGFRVPDHTDLPCSDGEIVENTQELPQTILLTEALRKFMLQIHPDEQYLLAGNSGIYWTLTDPPLRGAVAPDWFYVPGVSPGFLNGVPRRSYVIWKEKVTPFIVMEFISQDDRRERDTTPNSGKFWVYEKAIKVPYYVIFDPDRRLIDLYGLTADGYRLHPPNERGHYSIPSLGLELGLWDGKMMGMDLCWMRWYDHRGELLPMPYDMVDEEIAKAEREARRADEEARRADEQSHRADEEARRAEEQSYRADEEARRADEQLRRAEALAAKLRSLGIDPDASS